MDISLALQLSSIGLSAAGLGSYLISLRNTRAAGRAQTFDAVALLWITEGGKRDEAHVRRRLSVAKDDELAIECLDTLERNDTDPAELTAAFGRLRQYIKNKDARQ